MRHDIAVPLPGPLRDVALSPFHVKPSALAEIAAQSTRQEKEAIERAVAGLKQAAAIFRTGQQEQLGDMQRTIVRLAIGLASQLTHERIRLGDFAVEALVQKVVQRLRPRQAVTVYLNPDDLHLLEQRLGDEPLFPPHGPSLRVEGDASVNRGDCRAESGDTSVSWLLEDQWEEISQHLLRSLGNEDESTMGEAVEHAGR